MMLIRNTQKRELALTEGSHDISETPQRLLDDGGSLFDFRVGNTTLGILS